MEMQDIKQAVDEVKDLADGRIKALESKNESLQELSQAGFRITSSLF